MELPPFPLDIITLASTGGGAAALGVPALLLGPSLSVRQGRVVAWSVAGLLAAGAAAAVYLEIPHAFAALSILLALWLTGLLLRSSALAWGLNWVGYAMRAPRLQAALLLALAPVLVVGAVYRDEQELQRAGELPVLENCDPMLKPVDAEAWTDAGEAVPLFAAQSDGTRLVETEQGFAVRPQFQMKLIRTAPPSMDSNCHGWVFTGGRHWLCGSAVPPILNDNGYSEVSQPQPGDLAIWRDLEGRVLHTGLVRLVPSEGPPVLESKWGQLGRYLHGPDDQLYGSELTYYRSPRDGHLLRGLEPNYRNAAARRPTAG